MKYILDLRYTKVLSYILAKKLQEIRLESHQHRYGYYYGLQVLTGGTNKIILLILLGMLFNCLTETIIVCISFGVLRMFAGGFHLRSYSLCTYFSISLFIILGILSKAVTLNIIVSVIVFILFLIYAPVENKNKPIEDKDINKFKLISIINLAILSLIYLIFNVNEILWGILLSGIIILPIFNKRG